MDGSGSTCPLLDHPHMPHQMASAQCITGPSVSCDAALSAGLRTTFCLRPGNPHQDPGQHGLIQSFRDLMP